MKIKIEIIGVFPEDITKVTSSQRNKFEDIALFLDCTTVQTIIKNFRKRIKIQKVIPYEKFDEWVKQHGIIQDELSREERSFLSDLDYDIDYLSNKPFEELSKDQKDELNQKEEERLRWLDLYYTFSRALKKKLQSLKVEKFLQILIKAIICGEVRNEDLSDELVEIKGARKTIFVERQLFWDYKLKKDIRIGYGRLGKQINKNLQSTRSNINSYKYRLLKCEEAFKNLK